MKPLDHCYLISGSRVQIFREALLCGGIFGQGVIGDIPADRAEVTL